MNPGTARHRLVQDILFQLIQGTGQRCFHCGGELTRETFSIEHKTPWIDSENPRELFFDLTNIGFSHLTCNVGAARKAPKLSEERLKAKRNESERKRYWKAKAAAGEPQKRFGRKPKYEMS
jgi:hypothetical protein